MDVAELITKEQFTFHEGYVNANSFRIDASTIIVFYVRPYPQWLKLDNSGYYTRHPESVNLDNKHLVGNPFLMALPISDVLGKAYYAVSNSNGLNWSTPVALPDQPLDTTSISVVQSTTDPKTFWAVTGERYYHFTQRQARGSYVCWNMAWDNNSGTLSAGGGRTVASFEQHADVAGYGGDCDFRAHLALVDGKLHVFFGGFVSKKYQNGSSYTYEQKNFWRLEAYSASFGSLAFSKNLDDANYTANNTYYGNLGYKHREWGKIVGAGDATNGYHVYVVDNFGIYRSQVNASSYSDRVLEGAVSSWMIDGFYLGLSENKNPIISYLGGYTTERLWTKGIAPNNFEWKTDPLGAASGGTEAKSYVGSVSDTGQNRGVWAVVYPKMESVWQNSPYMGGDYFNTVFGGINYQAYQRGEGKHGTIKVIGRSPSGYPITEWDFAWKPLPVDIDLVPDTFLDAPDGAYADGGASTVCYLQNSNPLAFQGGDGGLTAHIFTGVWQQYTSQTLPTYDVWLYHASSDINTPPRTTLQTPTSVSSVFDQTTDTIPLTWNVTDSDDDDVATQWQGTIREYGSGSTYYSMVGDGTLTVLGVESPVVLANQVAAGSTYISPGQLMPSDRGYEWTVRAGDKHGSWGRWAVPFRFQVAGRPSCTITYPDDGAQIDVNKPTIEWTFSDPEGSGQSAYKFNVYRDDGRQLYTSGSVTSGEQKGKLDYRLSDNTNYSIGVSVMDRQSMWSVQKNVSISTLLKDPEAPTIIDTVLGDFTVNLSFSWPNTVQPYAITYDLYRWNPMVSRYVQLVRNTSIYVNSYLDTRPPRNIDFHYKIVTQSDTGGELDTLSDTIYVNTTGVPGVPGDPGSPVENGPDWYLSDGYASLKVDVVSFDKDFPVPTKEYEPLGRSRKVSAVNQQMGATGSMVIYVSASERATLLPTLYALVGSPYPVYINNPFGEVIAASLKSPEIEDRIGGGADVTVAFVEIEEAY
jgi:hypothetical protein